MNAENEASFQWLVDRVDQLEALLDARTNERDEARESLADAKKLLRSIVHSLELIGMRELAGIIRQQEEKL